MLCRKKPPSNYRNVIFSPGGELATVRAWNLGWFRAASLAPMSFSSPPCNETQFCNRKMAIDDKKRTLKGKQKALSATCCVYLQLGAGTLTDDPPCFLKPHLLSDLKTRVSASPMRCKGQSGVASSCSPHHIISRHLLSPRSMHGHPQESEMPHANIPCLFTLVTAAE